MNIKFLRGKLKDDLLRHGGLMFAAGIAGGVFNFLLTIYANRNMSGSDYSLFYNLAQLSMLLGVIGMTMLGMVAKQIAYYRTSAGKDEIAYFYTHILGKISVVALLFFLVLLPFSSAIAGFFNRPDANMSVIATIILIAVSIAVQVPYGALQGLEKFKKWSSAMIFFSASRLLLGILLIELGFRITGAISASIIAYLAAFGLISYWIRDLYSARENPVEVSLIDFYKSSWWILLSFLCGFFISMIDIPIVQHFLEQQAPDYASASMLARTIFYLPYGFAAVMYPKVSAARGGGEPVIPILKKALIYSFIVCIVAAVVIAILADFIVSLLLNPIYHVTVPGLLRVFVFALLPLALTMILVYFNIAAHRVRAVWVLLILALMHLLILSLFHKSAMMVIMALGISSGIVFTALFVFTYRFDYQKKETKLS